MQVLRYLGRYSHRVAISNHRWLAFDQERVTFRWKDYARGGNQRQMTLTATEFLRRFFLHVRNGLFIKWLRSTASAITEYQKVTPAARANSLLSNSILIGNARPSRTEGWYHLRQDHRHKD